MSDLLSILNSGSSSLAAHRAAAATASHNLQNANTPGFARQRAELAAMTPAHDLGYGQVGRGVTVTTITQSRDRFLERQLPGALSSQARSTAEADVLESLSALDPGQRGRPDLGAGRFLRRPAGAVPEPRRARLADGRDLGGSHPAP